MIGVQGAMAINFDVVIETPEYEVDMKAGLDTLQGISDATRIISETLLTQKVPQRISYKSDVRTTLKKTFPGSYGHIFSLDLMSEELKKQYRKIGSATFSELMSYFTKEALHIDVDVDSLSEKAQKTLDSLGDNTERLIEQLRESPLRNIHEVPKKFGYKVILSRRSSANNREVLVKFDKETSLVLEAKRTDERVTLLASIRRLNTNTGNGRLQVQGGEETVAFGFSTMYRDVRLATKKKFSENLDYNNGIDIEHWKYLEIIAAPVKLQDEKIVKYIVLGFHDE